MKSQFDRAERLRAYNAWLTISLSLIVGICFCGFIGWMPDVLPRKFIASVLTVVYLVIVLITLTCLRDGMYLFIFETPCNCIWFSKTTGTMAKFTKEPAVFWKWNPVRTQHFFWRLDTNTVFNRKVESVASNGKLRRMTYRIPIAVSTDNLEAFSRFKKVYAGVVWQWVANAESLLCLFEEEQLERLVEFFDPHSFEQQQKFAALVRNWFEGRLSERGLLLGDGALISFNLHNGATVTS